MKQKFKKISVIILGILIGIGVLFTTPTHAHSIESSNKTRIKIKDDSPKDIVARITDEANDNKYTRVQDNKLNDIDNVGNDPTGRGGNITKTLMWLSGRGVVGNKGLWSYLQWAVFIGLTGAVILIIWNGFLMVTKGAEGAKKAKENFKNIAIGVIVITSFVAIIQLVTALINIIFKF